MGCSPRTTSSDRAIGAWIARTASRLPLPPKSIVVIAIITLGLGCFPLFSRPGYETALLFGLLVPPITAADAALGMAKSGEIEQRLLAALGRAVSHAFVMSGILCLHALRVGWCSPGHDLALLALGPVAGIITAAFWGAVAGLGVDRFQFRRGARLAAIGAALIGPLVGIGVSLVRFYGSPSVFAFDPFVGFFAGSPYDTGFDPTARLLSYRTGTAGVWLFLWAVARHLTRGATGRIQWRNVLQRDGRARIRLGPELDRAAAFLGLFGLGLFAVITVRGEALGHRSSTAWIRSSLGRSITLGRCEVVYGPAQKLVQIERLAADCEAWLIRLERRLGTGPVDHVTAYVFDSPAQKELLMGAAQTQIAKPWRREIYLNGVSFPDDVVGHELAHVVAGLAARGPFEIAGGFGGWLPNPGLIEGLAVALAPDEDGDLTAIELTYALHSAQRLPDLQQLFSLSFLTHAGPVGYTVAGAFVEWIGQNYGKRAVREWYGGRSIAQATGETFATLSQRFIASLSAVTLSDASRAVALVRFSRPGVYSRRCPHAVDSALAEANQRLASGDSAKAEALYSEARRLDPTDVRARFGLGACAERLARTKEQIGQAEATYRSISEDGSLPSPLRQRALEKIADLRLASGHPEAARPLYEQLLNETADIDRRRSLGIKLAAKTQTELEAVKALLLPGDSEMAWDLAVRSLLQWSKEEPDDGLADYLLGRNFWQRGRETAAVEHLDRALDRGIQPHAAMAEALRLRAIAACALGDKARAEDLAERLSQEPSLPTPRRVGLLRIVERCAGRPVGDDWPERAAMAGPNQPTGL
jgi:tetratricopeptide (TPR) repeat protein